MVSGRESGISGLFTAVLVSSKRMPNLVTIWTLFRTSANASPTSFSFSWGSAAVP